MLAPAGPCSCIMNLGGWQSSSRVSVTDSKQGRIFVKLRPAGQSMLPDMKEVICCKAVAVYPKRAIADAQSRSL